jgi:antirestriction protein
MSIEQLNQEEDEEQRPSERQQAWDVWRYCTGREDRTQFVRAYEGHFSSRRDFGERMLRESYNADDRLAALPPWLRRYVHLDGEQFATDFEKAGHYRIVEVPDSGVFVFDGAALSLAGQDEK